MNKMIETDFNFNPIGQGCFYTGYISINQLKFNFVYDCGTDSKMEYLENRIDIYKAKLVENQLDLLIISHFDADHVNGVIRLLNGIRCKKLVIPYYEPIERLLLYTTTTSDNDDYRLMLQNPINFFSGERFNIDEIILVGGPDDDDENSNDETIPKPPRDKKSLNKLNEDKNINIEFITNYRKGNNRNKFIKRLEEREIYLYENDKLQFLNKPYSLRNNFWEFVFYLKKHDNNILIKNFTNDVNILLGKYKIDIRDIFNIDYINEIRRIYRKYYGKNLNATSLVTYHGPLFNIDTDNEVYYSDMRSSWWCSNDCICNKMGTLLTGDIDISTQPSKTKLLNYFNTYVDQVCIFQVPHHGAKLNFPLRNTTGLEIFCNYVINHGLGRKHHPSIDVVDFIKNDCAQGKLHLNNESYKFRYGFHIYR